MSSSTRLKVAVVGPGISGLSAAWLLRTPHDMTVYEKTGRIGGPFEYGFRDNPLSIYFCVHHDGGVAALIYGVHSTFGERHSYVLPGSPEMVALRQACDKRFFVPPFLPMDMGYKFQIAQPAETIMVAIRACGADGPALDAVLSEERRDLTDSTLLCAALSVRFVSPKTTSAGRWEAIRLAAKGVVYSGRDS